jgi:hypothetical protein
MERHSLKMLLSAAVRLQEMSHFFDDHLPMDWFSERVIFMILVPILVLSEVQRHFTDPISIMGLLMVMPSLQARVTILLVDR